MAFLEWDNSFNVGVDDIDEQHKRLIEIINTLHDAMMCGKDHAILESVLASLLGYTEHHFLFEEDLMDKSDYPYSVQHKAAHKDIKAKLFKLQAEYSEGRPGANMHVMEFLKVWLIDHIIMGNEDMKLGRYVSSSSSS